jgi:hypothetical protein
VKTIDNMRQLLRLLLALLVLSSMAVVYACQKGGANAPTLTAQDYIDIQQLIARYAVAIDECTNKGYDYAALYADDGWFTSSRDGRLGTKVQGREKLAETARGGMKSCDEVPWKGIKHIYVNLVIVPSAEGATGRSDLIAIGFDGDPHKVEHQGHHEDVYVKTPKGWLFQSRIYAPATGQAAVSSGSKR